MDWLLWMRSLEFRTPPRLARVVLQLSGGRYEPYRACHDRLRTIFVHIPKTAGSSITMALCGEQPRHVPLSRYLARDRQRFQRYFKFAFVRNPWDRLHSAYVYLTGPEKPRSGDDAVWVTRRLGGLDTFEGFVRALEDRRRRRSVLSYIHFRPQVDWIRIGARGHGCDFVGRFEALDDDFAAVSHRLGVVRPLPVRRKRTRAPYREVYSRRMAERVADWYAEDIGMFGYRF